MKRRTAFISLVTILVLTLGTLSCGQGRVVFGNSSDTGPGQTRSSERSITSSDIGGGLSDLRGSHWDLIYWGVKTKPTRYETTPNMQFCKDGTWAAHRYGGGDSYQENGGRYQISGDQLSLQDDNGGFTGDYLLLSRDGNELKFESKDGYVMDLKYVDSKDCSR